MNLKLLGSALVILACGAYGFLIAAAHRREVKLLRQLIGVLEQMEWELQYRMTPLPELCRGAARTSTDALQKLLWGFTAELENQISPDAERCMSVALDRITDLPKVTKEMLHMLGQLLGRYDLDGQLKGLAAVRHACRSNLEKLESNQDVRLRSYQTLGLCTGAAIVIMLI